MKLRARKTRVALDVKPERSKVKLEMEASLMTLPANDSQQQALVTSDSGNVEIKQEQDVYLRQMNKQLKRDLNEDNTFSGAHIAQEKTTQSSSALLQRAEYYYQCDMCTQRFPNFKSVLEHRVSIHNVQCHRRRLVKNIDTEPDIHDPNFYCKSCQKEHSNTRGYRQHLKSAHFMALKPITRWKTPRNNDVVPDLDDPNRYCKACNFTYKHKRSYQMHCQQIHGLMTSAKVAKTMAKANDTIHASSTSCKFCDGHLSTTGSYRNHLFAVHIVDWWQLAQQKPPPQDNVIMPDANDPNFYCRSCQKKLSGKHAFKVHLKMIHSIFPSAPKKTTLNPIVHDPNNYCRACRRTYSSKINYRTHLRLVHQMTLPSLKVRSETRENQPDPNNPHYDCHVCKVSFKARGQYRAHCRLVHYMVLDHNSITNPNATIDINNPNLFCAQCEKTFSQKSNFKTHLKRVHRI